jgi:hypothetical protein
VAEDGNALPSLQRVDSVGVNGVHAIVITPFLVRVEMIRIERTYDLLWRAPSSSMVGEAALRWSFGVRTRNSEARFAQCSIAVAAKS